MADDVELIALARERILETFQIDLQREVLEMLVGGRDVLLIPPTGSGKSDFSVRSDILRHRQGRNVRSGSSL